MTVIAGSIYISSDGINWTLGLIDIQNYVSSLAYGNGIFVVGLANNGYILVITTDGISYTTSTNITSVLSGQNLISSIGFNGKIWQIGANGGANYQICYSFNGYTWYGSSSSTIIEGGIAYGPSHYTFCSNGLIWLAGTYSNHGIIYSRDGINWQATTNSDTYIVNNCTSITYNGSEFIACGGQNVPFVGILNYNVISSSDGLVWTPVTDANLFFTNGTQTIISKTSFKTLG
jgi:hypothetical protein